MLHRWQKGRNMSLESILKKSILVFVDDRNEDRVIAWPDSHHACAPKRSLRFRF